MHKIVKYWPLVLAGIGLIVWLVRLEAKVNDAGTAVDVATSAQKLDDLKERVDRVEKKIDTLLSRGGK